jgi:hypothetical protein
MARAPQPRPPHLEEWLLGVAVLTNVAVALAVRHFPYQDIVNHLTRYVLLDRALAGQVPDWLAVRWLPTTRIAADLGGVALVHLLGPRAALRVLAVVPLLLLPGGMYLLLRTTAPSQRGWALVGALFGFCWYYLTGLQDFMQGLALLFFWLALWWPRRLTTRWSARLWLGVGCAALLFVHLSAPLLAIGVVGVSYLLEAVQAFHRRRSAAAFGSPQLVTLVVVTVVVGVALAGTAAFAVSGSGDMGPPYFRPWGGKVLAMASPFLSFSNGQLAVMLAGFLLAVAGLLHRQRAADLVTPLALCGPAFLLVYFLSPRYIIGAGDVDVRWLPAAYLLPFCMATTARPPGTALLKALFAVCIVHALVVFVWARRIDRDLDDYDAVIATLPPEAPVLPLSTDGGRFGRVRPYEYYGLWHTIRGGGQVPALFSGTGMRRNGPPMHHFDHIRVLYQTYQPPPEWGVRNWEPLDCAAIRHDYSYVIQAGADARTAALIRGCAREERRIGQITLYRVVPADTSGRRAP